MRRHMAIAVGCAVSATLAGCGVPPRPPVTDSDALPGDSWHPAEYATQQRGLVDAALRLATPQAQQYFYLLREANAFRAANGLPALVADRNLIPAAARHSQNMATRNYMAHNSPEGTTPADRMRAAGATFNSWAENIGYQSPPDGTAAQRMMTFWRTSPGHRANLLNPTFKRTGIYPHRRTSDGYWYYTQVFAD